MYKKGSFSSILIVKMSSLGDIVQAFSVLDYLRSTFPEAAIDWVTEEAFVPLVSAHPYIRNAFGLNVKELKKGWRKWGLWKKLFSLLSRLRGESYDVLFDLQGNCKSGLVTFFSRARTKVGFGFRSVREKPSALFTNVRFNVSKQINIREQYLELVKRFCQRSYAGAHLKQVKLKISEAEEKTIRKILAHPFLQTPLKIMVCPGSQWINKQIPLETLCLFLEEIKRQLPASFLLVWGSDAEKDNVENVHQKFPESSALIEKLPIAVWQNLMHEIDIVIAVDSSALHLCGITKTYSFSVFGPTSPKVFKPLGDRHFAFQGICPYGKEFDKLCPLLRSCPTGACMKQLRAEDLAHSFMQFVEKIGLKNFTAEGAETTERERSLRS